MSAPEPEKEKLRLVMGHVLFLDTVGYSKLLMNEQSEALQDLNQIVREADAVCEADKAGQLIRLPTGDGMALVFTDSLETPVEAALQISRALRLKPGLGVRMGIHSGPVQHTSDVNDRANIAGAGINLAQRVMVCGDAGHILLSKHVAEDLENYGHWKPLLHELGECEVKHGARVSLVNLFSEDFGNPEPPFKCGEARTKTLAAEGERGVRIWRAVALAALLILIAAVLGFFWLRFGAPRQTEISAPSVPRPISKKSIAVLPFDNWSEEKANAFFADGMQDEILSRLARITELKVISRSSVMQYKSGVGRNLREIGQQLGVAHLVEGSVQRVGQQVRVNAQLIDTSNDEHLWAHSYTGDLTDVFGIQSEIAQAIADQLQAKLSPNEKAALAERPTSDLTAFEQYTRARTLLLTGLTTTQSKSFLQAVELLESAVQRDPGFYAAWCQLVFVNESLYSLGYDHTPARLAAAEEALRHVARLRPDAPETHLARGWHLYYGPRDYEGALAELKIAARGLANDPRVFESTGYILRRQGKYQEGLRALEQAIALDPRNVFVLAQIALSHQLLRQYPEEAVVLASLLKIAPDDISAATSRAGLDLLWRADPKPLHRLIDQVRVEQPARISEAAVDWLICALAERDWPAAEQALTALGDARRQHDRELRHAQASALLGSAAGRSRASKKSSRPSRRRTDRRLRTCARRRRFESPPQAG